MGTILLLNSEDSPPRYSAKPVKEQGINFLKNLKKNSVKIFMTLGRIKKWNNKIISEPGSVYENYFKTRPKLLGKTRIKKELN